MTTGKFDFYAANSGLEFGSLDDHMLAYYSQLSGLAKGTLQDHMLAYFQTANADTTQNLSYQQRKWFDAQTGNLGGTLADVQARFFAAPPSGGGGGGTGFGVAGYGTGGYGV